MGLPLTFSDSSCSYRLSVTDLSLRSYLDYQRVCRRLDSTSAALGVLRVLSRGEVYLRIGLSRHWSKFPDRCYLQIKGIYAFPDYLDGKCFGDFASALLRRFPASNFRPAPDDLEDLPF